MSYHFQFYYEAKFNCEEVRNHFLALLQYRKLLTISVGVTSSPRTVVFLELATKLKRRSQRASFFDFEGKTPVFQKYVSNRIGFDKIKFLNVIHDTITVRSVKKLECDIRERDYEIRELQQQILSLQNENRSLKEKLELEVDNNKVNRGTKRNTTKDKQQQQQLKTSGNNIESNDKEEEEVENKKDDQPYYSIAAATLKRPKLLQTERSLFEIATKSFLKLPTD